MSFDKFQTTTVFKHNIEAYHDKCDLIINQGGARCFSSEQKVITITGSKKISEIKQGDIVPTSGGLNLVSDVIRMDNFKKCLRVTLKNGEIIECTEDHEFFFQGGWYSLKDIISRRRNAWKYV